MTAKLTKLQKTIRFTMPPDAQIPTLAHIKKMEKVLHKRNIPATVRTTRTSTSTTIEALIPPQKTEMGRVIKMVELFLSGCARKLNPELFTR